MNDLKNTINKYGRTLPSAVKHLLFWGAIFIIYVLPQKMYFNSTVEFLEINLTRFGLQIVVAYIILLWLMPKLLNKGAIIVFLLVLYVLLLFISEVFITARYFYFEPTYPHRYRAFLSINGNLSYWDRLKDIKVLTLNDAMYYIQPTFFLIIIKFYKDKQRTAKLNEQKKTSELRALKNQLNPHLLFNTLNSLYVLALENSKKTPEVIEKLSAILDYILYRCDDTFVSLKKEIELIENYLDLEELRYEDRVVISLEKNVGKDAKIAPLLFLTFIENAFKHGISQELKKGKVVLKIELINDSIIFFVENTKPEIVLKKAKEENSSIGLKNVKNQLELLYPDMHNLIIKNEKNKYSVTLKIKDK